MTGFFSELPTTIVVDHMGRPDVTKPVDGPEFARFLKFMDDYENVWCKVTGAERLSVSGPPALNGETNAYRDVVPFARKVVEEFPDRVLWGTDWPHPNLKDHMPDDGLMVDIIPHIAPAPTCRTCSWSTIRCGSIGPRRGDAESWPSTKRSPRFPARPSSTPSSRARAIGSTSSACR